MGALPPPLRVSPGIFLSKRSWIVVGLGILAGCGGPPAGSLNPGLPGAVVERLPLDVDLNEVNRDVNGCYFYTYAASIFIVKDEMGQPLCIPG